MNAGGTYQVTEDIAVEFINIQHSIIDCVLAVVHTPVGAILYACDFKLDRTPTMGAAPDFGRLKALGKEGVIAMIVESTNAGRSGKTPSEQIAKDMVRDVLLGTEESEVGMIITTFASHIPRLKAIIEAAGEMGRTPVWAAQWNAMWELRDLGYLNCLPMSRCMVSKDIVGLSNVLSRKERTVSPNRHRTPRRTRLHTCTCREWRNPMN